MDSGLQSGDCKAKALPPEGGATATAKLRDSLLGTLASRQSLSEIFSSFVDVLGSMVRCDHYVLYRANGETLERVCGMGQQSNLAPPSCPTEPILIPDAQCSTAASGGLRSYLLMPIYMRGKPHGALELGSRVSNALREQHLGMLESAAQILGMVMVHEDLELRLQKPPQQSRRAATTLANILALWPHRMEMDLVAGLLAEGLEQTTCDIFLWDEQSQHLVLGASTAMDTAVDAHALPLHKGIVGAAAASQKALNVAEVRQDRRYLPTIAETRSELAVPVVDPCAGLLGVINLESTRAAAFSEEDVELLEGVAHFLALWMGSRQREKQQAAAAKEAHALALEGSRALEQLDELRAQVGSLQNCLVRAEQISALGRLVASAAHELNNPLTVVQGYAEMLLDHPLPPVVAQRVRAIHEQSRHAAAIVSGLVQLSRATPSNDPDAPEKPAQKSCDLTEAINDAVAACARELAKQNVVLTVEADVSLFVAAAPDDIHRLLTQLLKNAQDAVRSSERKEICVSLRRVGDSAELSVTDSGAGVDQETLAQIFEPFFTTKPAGFGVGLGLCVCAGIVQACGGAISVVTPPDGGASFIVTLPAVPDAQHPAHFGKAALVVSADEATGSLWQETLHGEHWQSVAAVSPAEVLQHLDRNHFDLILIDLPCAQQEGLALRAEIQRRGHDVPLLLVNGEELDPASRNLLEHSGCPLLFKPFRIGELREILEVTLKQPV